MARLTSSFHTYNTINIHELPDPYLCIVLRQKNNIARTSIAIVLFEHIHKYTYIEQPSQITIPAKGISI